MIRKAPYGLTQFLPNRRSCRLRIPGTLRNTASSSCGGTNKESK